MTADDQAQGTLARADKGPDGPAPVLAPAPESVAAAVRSWPGVEASVHWHLYAPDRVDGTDFYVDGQELGHIHLDGAIHLATSPALGATILAEGLAVPFPYAAGWVQMRIIGDSSAATAIALFRRNYDRLRAA